MQHTFYCQHCDIPVIRDVKYVTKQGVTCSVCKTHQKIISEYKRKTRPIVTYSEPRYIPGTVMILPIKSTKYKDADNSGKNYKDYLKENVGKVSQAKKDLMNRLEKEKAERDKKRGCTLMSIKYPLF